MSAVTEAAEGLVSALSEVDGVRYYRDFAASLDPPALVLSAPTLTWSMACIEPTEATFAAFLVVRSDDRTVERLWTLVESVTEAIDALDFAVVTEANPLSFAVGNTDMAAYEITIECAL